MATARKLRWRAITRPGQVAHVDLAIDLEPQILMTALNDHLPDGIRIRSATAARPTFHARFDARAKHYTYRARWSRRAPPGSITYFTPLWWARSMQSRNGKNASELRATPVKLLIQSFFS